MLSAHIAHMVDLRLPNKELNPGFSVYHLDPETTRFQARTTPSSPSSPATICASVRREAAEEIFEAIKSVNIQIHKDYSSDPFEFKMLNSDHFIAVPDPDDVGPGIRDS